MAVISRLSIFGLCLLLYVPSLYGAILPEDRTDILFHHYDGDNSTFNGPSVLVRKGFKDTVSVWGNYYVDFNSAASIDVVTQGSPYKEERVETSIGADYLHEKTILSMSVTNSSENDYEADSYSIGLSQDFFGDLSTLSMHYANGEDEIFQNIRQGPEADDIVDRTKFGEATHQRFGFGWTQVVWKNWIVAFNAEASVDEGFLRNPYRSVRYISGEDSTGVTVSREPENYPTTRNSEAYAIKSMTYLPWRGAIKVEGRRFTDSWDIKAKNIELKYIHPVEEHLILEFRTRYYSQTQASFYADLFNFEEEFVFRASDKELSDFRNFTLGFGMSYELKKSWLGWFDRGTVNLFYDHVAYDYDNFLDKRQSVADANDEISTAPTPDEGQEDPFSFNAHILRVFVSLWY